MLQLFPPISGFNFILLAIIKMNCLIKISGKIYLSQTWWGPNPRCSIWMNFKKLATNLLLTFVARVIRELTERSPISCCHVTDTHWNRSLPSLSIPDSDVSNPRSLQRWKHTWSQLMELRKHFPGWLWAFLSGNIFRQGLSRFIPHTKIELRSRVSYIIGTILK